MLGYIGLAQHVKHILKQQYIGPLGDYNIYKSTYTHTEQTSCNQKD